MKTSSVAEHTKNNARRPSGMPDFIEIDEEAIRRGEIPQALRDRGIVSVEIVDPREKRREQFNKRIDKIFDRLNLNIHSESRPMEMGDDIPQTDKSAEVAESHQGSKIPQEPRGMFHRQIQGIYDKLNKGFVLAREGDIFNYEDDAKHQNANPSQPGPENASESVNETDMVDSMSDTNTQENEAQPQQSMDEYQEEWVERFAQTKNGDERKHLMGELKERRGLHEYEEEFVEKFTKERNLDKRQGLVNALRGKQEAFDTSLSSSDISDLGSLDQNQTASMDASAVQLSASDIDDLSSTQTQQHSL